MSKPKTSKSRAGSGNTTTTEMIAAGLGAVAVVLTIGSLVYFSIAGNGKYPGLRVTQTGPSQKAGDGYVVPFTVANETQATAAQVRIVGELVKGGADTEYAEATLKYVPGRSTRRGGLIFRSNPEPGRLRLFATGYRDP